MKAAIPQFQEVFIPAFYRILIIIRFWRRILIQVSGLNPELIWIYKVAIRLSVPERFIWSRMRHFTSEAGVTLWAQGVKLSSAQVNLLGTTYLSDDLTIESGSGSRVTVQGEYYGYGYPESARSSLNNYMYDNPEKRWSDTVLSSSIVINGKNTTLDLSGVRKIMLAGRSYIGTSKVKPVNGESNSNDVMMGESITVKGTQLAYLLPSD